MQCKVSRREYFTNLSQILLGRFAPTWSVRCQQSSELLSINITIPGSRRESKDGS